MPIKLGVLHRGATADTLVAGGGPRTWWLPLTTQRVLDYLQENWVGLCLVSWCWRTRRIRERCRLLIPSDEYDFLLFHLPNLTASFVKNSPNFYNIDPLPEPDGGGPRTKVYYRTRYSVTQKGPFPMYKH